MKKLLSGIKPSGSLTLGNYIGAIKNFVEMQKDYESYIFVADLHAITVPQPKEELKKNIKDILALYIASGLHMDHTTIFLQSENPYHTELSWMLECHTYLGELNRMTQFKDKTAKGESNLSAGLYTYPILMASDIILYDADVVPVGEDQKQHVELARNLVERFNNKYGETFKMPTPIITKVGARIKDLQDPTKKMSKSDTDKGTIYLLDDLDVIRKKIMSAVTDSDTQVRFDEVNKPGISNLMTIYSSLTGKSMPEIEELFKSSNYGIFKGAVADVVVKEIEMLQAKYKEVINSNMINEILDKGLEKTLPMAKAKCEEVKEKIGLSRNG